MEVRRWPPPKKPQPPAPPPTDDDDPVDVPVQKPQPPAPPPTETRPTETRPTVPTVQKKPQDTPTPDYRSDYIKYGRLIDLGDARQVWFDVRDVNDDEKPDTILYKTEDRSKIFGVLDDYDGRAASHSDYALNADFFVDNTITVTDLDII